MASAKTQRCEAFFVAKVVKTFGNSAFEAESLDDFRYGEHQNRSQADRPKMLDSVGQNG